jgi:hypothetical protein
MTICSIFYSLEAISKIVFASLGLPVAWDVNSPSSSQEEPLMKSTQKNPFQKLKLLSLTGLTCLGFLIWVRLGARLGAGGQSAGCWDGQWICRRRERPNIIVILADDLGNADLGYRGSDIKTPNIDKLAREGVRVESALMTGRHPMCYGLQTLVIFPNHTCPRSLWFKV